MPTRRHMLSLAALFTAAVTAGCGITDPYSARRTAQTNTATASTQTSTRPDDPSERAGGSYPPAPLITGTRRSTGGPAGASSPTAAIDHYAHLYSNWTARTLDATERALATMSLGSARANALQAAASYGRDAILLKSNVANTGAVVSIAPDVARPGVWVVVTSERTAGRGDYAGLPAQLHVTYAQVARTPNGYLVSLWSPQT